ncbi:MAG: polymerase subfamily sigma factor [Anaerocolumna sp.]|jgi:RNA polymerase sigma-70 factor (ECF subfamily)|nr:polymerase subfamily sigma factor [Anaerocolumna sp.]
MFLLKGGFLMQMVRTEQDTIMTIEQYSDTLYKIALSYTRCKATAEDILQDTYLKYMQCPLEFESSEHKKAWLIRVLINECKKFYRLFWNSKRIPLEDIYTFESPEYHEIFYAVMDLTPKYRIVIHLYYYEEYSVKEISKILRVKENTILSRLHRARRMLKEDMEVAYEYKRV